MFNCYVVHAAKLNHLKVFEFGKEKELLDFAQQTLDDTFDIESKKKASNFLDNGIKAFTANPKICEGIVLHGMRGSAFNIYPGIK